MMHRPIHRGGCAFADKAHARMYLCPASGDTEINAYIEDQQEGIAGHEDIVEKSTRLSVQAEIVYQICGRQQKCIDQLPPHEPSSLCPIYIG